jgi:hypothetical protein
MKMRIHDILQRRCEDEHYGTLISRHLLDRHYIDMYSDSLVLSLLIYFFCEELIINEVDSICFNLLDII